MKKKLTRNMQDKKIEGVCSGIADYFELDPTIVRLAFAIGALVWGTTILVYIVCWMVLPKGNSLEM